jgi:hypothetical protein
MKRKKFKFEESCASTASRLVLFPYAIPGTGAVMVAIVSSAPRRESEAEMLRSWGRGEREP